jgi:hypothetical protein
MNDKSRLKSLPALTDDQLQQVWGGISRQAVAEMQRIHKVQPAAYPRPAAREPFPLKP